MQKKNAPRMPLMRKCLIVTLCISFAGLFLSGCAGSRQVIKIQLEQARRLIDVTPRFDKPGGKPVIAIPLLQRDDHPLEPDYTRIERGAERVMTEQVERALTRADHLELVDRRYISRLMDELHFQSTDLVDESNRSHLGRLLAADYLLLGKVNRYLLKTYIKGSNRILVEIAEIAFDLEIVEVESGRVVWKSSHSGTGRRLLSSETVEFSIDPIRSVILENDCQDKSSLKDILALAELLVHEATATLCK